MSNQTTTQAVNDYDTCIAYFDQKIAVLRQEQARLRFSLKSQREARDIFIRMAVAQILNKE